MLIVFDAADAQYNEGDGGNDVGAVRFPELEQLLTPQFFVDFPGEAISLVNHAFPMRWSFVSLGQTCIARRRCRRKGFTV